MAQRWDERLALWYGAATEKLRKRWWAWPVVIAIEVAWHLTYGNILEFLKSREGAAFHALTVVWAHIPSDPVVVATLIAIGAAMQVRFLPQTRRPWRARSAWTPGSPLGSCDLTLAPERLWIKRGLPTLLIPNVRSPAGAVSKCDRGLKWRPFTRRGRRGGKGGGPVPGAARRRRPRTEDRWLERTPPRSRRSAPPPAAGPRQQQRRGGDPPTQLPESPSASHASSDLCRSDGGVDVAVGKHANDGAAFDDERPLEVEI